jgi:penicillin-binding protein 1A
VPTVKLADDVGIRNVIAAAQATGNTAEMFPNLATALGSASVSPLEMAASYAVFANGGYRVEPTLLAQVVDRNGQSSRGQAQPQRVWIPGRWRCSTKSSKG